jgi:hypothetical protein
MNLTQRLRALKSEIESAERLAAAEKAFEATGAPDNPWKGAAEKRDALLEQQRAIELQIEGETLRGKLEQLRLLDAELVKAQEARVLADEAVRAAAEHEAVMRWVKAGSIARAVGVAYDFEGVFSAWYLSGRERFAGAPACTSYFMDNPNTHAGLRFTEQDRPAIIRWHQAKGAAQAAIIHWSALAEQRALLLREAPELATVA